MNKDYSYDDESVCDELEKAEMYWRGREDGRLDAGGGLFTWIAGAASGALFVVVVWIACAVML